MTNQPQFENPTKPTAPPPVMEDGYQEPTADPVLYAGQELQVPETGIVTATPVGHNGVRGAAEERDAWSMPGGIALIVLLAVGLVAIGFGVFGAIINAPLLSVLGVALFVAMYFGFTSLTVIQ